mmetsp:Transcript_9722/g.32526  ORF Transcript_9722/g.32526 Transcript_9722/m.32526 type:complete len:2440 (+) Transcript_9722:200-7519(+)
MKGEMVRRIFKIALSLLFLDGVTSATYSNSPGLSVVSSSNTYSQPSQYSSGSNVLLPSASAGSYPLAVSQPPQPMVSSLQLPGLAGWSTLTLKNQKSSVQLVAGRGSGVSGSDTNDEIWYFVSPTDSFSGDLSAAYNGKLSFTLIHAQTPLTATPLQAPDVIIEASCGFSLMMFQATQQGGSITLILNEGSGWIDSRTKKKPSTIDMLGVLSHVKQIKIRGGYYPGAEATSLSTVALYSGNSWYPCCNLDGTIDMCKQAPSAYYNPTGLKFYCQGHEANVIKVKQVLPRYSRRSGGASITVLGENFGLTGSNPIVRINGKACRKTSFPASIVRDESRAQKAAAGDNNYILSGAGDVLKSPNNMNGNTLHNAYNSATDTMKQQYPEHCWNGMQDDGTSKGYNYGTAAIPKYIDQGETGIDTGGPCFPTHCSSCPVPGGSHSRCSSNNQVLAVQSGTCVGRGSQTTACTYGFPYLKYPFLCPDDAVFTTNLGESYTDFSGTTGFRKTYQQKKWNIEGLFATVKDDKMIEGITTIKFSNSVFLSTQAGTSKTTSLNIYIEDAVALCGFNFFDLKSTAATALSSDFKNNFKGRTTVSVAQSAALANGGTSLTVENAAVLLAEGTGPWVISCGDTHNITVTSWTGNVLTLQAVSSASNCQSGSVVTLNSLWTVQLDQDPTSGTMDYFTSSYFPVVTSDDPAYVVIGQEIVRVSGVSGSTLYITERGSFNSPVGDHTTGSAVRAVEVCRNSVVRIQQQSKNAAASNAVPISTNAVCQGYSPASAKDGHFCFMKVSSQSALPPAINPGDIVRRIAAGETTAVSTLSNGGSELQVTDVLKLLGTADCSQVGCVVSCGSDTYLQVNSYTLNNNTLYLNATTVDNVMSSSCTSGSLVVRNDGNGNPWWEQRAFKTQDESVFQVYDTTVDSKSDLQEFTAGRYIQMDAEIMLIMAINGSIFDVKRAQLGTQVSAHKRGSQIELLSRRAILSSTMKSDDSVAYLTSSLFISSNNLVVSNIQGSTRQIGGTNTIGYIKIDDEIMKVVSTTSSSNTASITVLRGQKGTIPAQHHAMATIYFLSCMDGDETGNNCGGSCKPCPSSRNGPQEHSILICETPPAGLSSQQSMQNFEVTVEASPAAKSSPFITRMNYAQTGWEDVSTRSISCISDQNRGFQYGSYDFVWGLHFSSAGQPEDVQVYDMATDPNTGDTYVIGSLHGYMTIKGKHIAMNQNLLGRLTVTTASNTYLVVNSSTTTLNTITFTGGPGSGSLDYVGSTIIVVSATPNYGCKATITAFNVTSKVATTTDFSRVKDGNCDMSGAESFHLYTGSASFIAKMDKVGKPLWLNKIDTAAGGQVASIQGITVDASSGNHYVVGYYSDGLPSTVENVTLNIYNVDTQTRVASSTPAKTLQILGTDTYGQVTSQTNAGANYQEAFVIKYSNLGQFINSEVIKGTQSGQELVVSNLKIRCFHASTSNVINTQVRSTSNPPNVPTSVTRTDVEYDRGIAVSGSKGTGQSPGYIVLANTAASYFAASGQDLVNTAGTVMDKWYNGLTITITCGKGIGQSRKIQDYKAATRTAYVQPDWDGNGEMTPDSTSCYVISGKPSSDVKGEHWANGGVYITGKAQKKDLTSNFVCYGQMPDAYKVTVGVPVCAALQQNVYDEFNFLAQYDNDLRVFWVRFMYDGQVSSENTVSSGSIAAVASHNDMIFVVGTFGHDTKTTDTVSIRIQNCTFNTQTVTEGPPANTQPQVKTLKKLCRTQSVSASGVVSANQDYVVQNTVASDYVQLGYTPSASSTKQSMYVAAYDATGFLVWYHFVSASGDTVVDATQNNFILTPTAIAFLDPVFAGSRLQVPQRSASDPIPTQRIVGSPGPVSTLREGYGRITDFYIYVTGQITTNSDSNYADFGATKYPLSCSRDKTVGVKGISTLYLNDAICSGKLRSLSTLSDIFLVKYSGNGAPAKQGVSGLYGNSLRQPQVEWIRRTGGETTSETASSVAVNAISGEIFVIGSYQASAASKYQGSNMYTSSAQPYFLNSASSTVQTNLGYNGDDIFGLKTAGRVNSLGCPMLRASPVTSSQESLGNTGLPDCTMYSHAASTSTWTGFVVTFDDVGTVDLRPQLNYATASYTGKVVQSGTQASPCDGSAVHILTNQACANSPRGCSCLSLSVTSATVSSANSLDGMKVTITKGTGAGYTGVISCSTTCTFAYNVIPAFSTVPDGTSVFQLRPYQELLPATYTKSCASKNIGCNAYGVKWAKTIGLPIGQSAITVGPYGGPTNLKNGGYGPWKQVGMSTSTADVLYLAQSDAVRDPLYYSQWILQISTDTQAPYRPTAVALVGNFTQPSTGQTNGGSVQISCLHLTGSNCPTTITAYRFTQQLSEPTVGIDTVASYENRQQSSPQSIAVLNSGVYVAGWFKGFDKFSFGIEGVDETIGYRSVNDDTWESYMVKLSD